MKDRLYIATALLTLAVLSACSADETDVERCATRGNVISLTSTLAVTRAAGDLQTTQIDTAVVVGVFGADGTSLVTGGNNAAYTVSSDGSLTAKSGTMEWPATGSISLYAYAPYRSGWTQGTDDFNVATDQTTAAGYLNSDLLYGTPAANPVEQTEDAVTLTFRHLLSKMTVKVVKADEETDITDAVLYICGTHTGTTLNLATGQLGEASGETADIRIASPLGQDNTACAVVVPQTIAAGTRLVRMLLADRMLTATVASPVTLEGGKAYTFTFKVENAELLLGNVTVNDWVTGDTWEETDAVDETGNVESNLGDDATEPARSKLR